MKSVLAASVAALALTAGLVSAQAADIRQPAQVVKAPVYVAPVFTWTGPYIGINGGWGWGNSHVNGGFPSGNLGPDGGLVGGTIGYNWQMGQAVVGVEGDIDWSGIRGNGACGVSTCRVNNYWLGTARGRLGYNAGRFMPYVTGGLAFGDVHTHIAGVGDTETTKAGWTIGGGIEAAISGPWTAKLEYLYVDLGRGDSVTGSGGSAADFKTNIFRAGINYKF